MTDNRCRRNRHFGHFPCDVGPSKDGIPIPIDASFHLVYLAGCLAEAKKPEDGQDYDDQTDDINKSIHDLSCEYLTVALCA
jgi:hypothetical protein